MHDFLVTDEGVINAGQWVDDLLNKDRSVYEVIRLIDGVALFLEDHFDRLLSSARISDIELNMGIADFELAVKKLMKANQQNLGNIKFMLTKTDGQSHWSLSFIPHSYPVEKQYREGVPTGLLYAERINPKAKVIQRSVREKADQMIADKKLFEVLLVDRNGSITEGSRSNVFFVKGDYFYTAPASMVLSGVTRKNVLNCLNELNFKLIEEAVQGNDVNHYDAVFLTGTSPKILPVNAIDAVSITVDHPYVTQLMDYYNTKVEEYISHKKRMSKMD